MKKSDVIVIGAGLAGLTAAALAAEYGLSVTVLAKGAGTLAFGGGTVDVLGCYNGKGILSARRGLELLPPTHPYAITGTKTVEDALFFFQKLCQEADYPLEGSLDSNTLVATSAGTLKPSCLVPRTMNTACLAEAREVFVVSFSGLKDFYPSLIIKGLRRHSALADIDYRTAVVEPDLDPGRDVTVLDIARWLDTKAGQQSLVRQLKDRIPTGSVLLVPPVLGTQPSYDAWETLQEMLGVRMIELAAPPPGITGNRIRMLLLHVLKQKRIALVEQAYVRRAEVQDGRCLAVATKHIGRERTYEANAFILAAGGFLGGGLTAEPSGVRESIFDLPVAAIPVSENLSAGLLDAAPIFQSGLTVDALMRPLDRQGKVALENVYAVGSILAGYDYSSEKSGNGVAVVSAYQAVKAVAERCKV